MRSKESIPVPNQMNLVQTRQVEYKPAETSEKDFFEMILQYTMANLEKFKVVGFGFSVK